MRTLIGAADISGRRARQDATAGALWALAENPEQFAKVKADPSLISGLIEESIRWVTPVKHFMRSAVADCEIGGQQIKAGDSLAMLYLSANRDEEAFADPFRFDVQRTNSRHLAFGFGVHFCLGRLLALNEIKSFFKQLLQRVEHIELAGEAVQAQSNFVGTLKSLPVRYRFGV